MFGRVREYLGRFENVPAGLSTFGQMSACSGSFEYASPFADGGTPFSLVRDCTHSCANVRSRARTCVVVRSHTQSDGIVRFHAQGLQIRRSGQASAAWSGARIIRTVWFSLE